MLFLQGILHVSEHMYKYVYVIQTMQQPEGHFCTDYPLPQYV